MSRRILGMRTTNWTTIANNRSRRGSRKFNPNSGDYDWRVEYLDASGRTKKTENVKSDHIDEVRTYAFSNIEYGQQIKIDGQEFTK